ncbi:MAG: family 20 glycosylhydrolase [Verrucomicrobia bacterium]|nr:family 20 glycosylhydrolase [Verrucomicrobiota bacterium]
MPLNLLPTPRSLKILRGTFTLPKQKPLAATKVVRSKTAPNNPEGYSLTIDRRGVRIEYRETGGLRAAGATLRQLLREYGRRLPCLKIRDWPDFARRGVMLDISRGRVPKLEMLLDLVERLADFKINEFQLYTEHTFAYRNYKSVWQSWGALTAAEIRTLDARCCELGIDLVPNQNSFGHLRYFLEQPRLKKLAEISEPYEGSTGDYLRYPTTLAPNNPGTIKFIRELYDELLPNFSSKFLNVGCDETWDLGRGQSKKVCERRGKGRVYLDFLKKIHREASKRGKRMMFWGDIILHHPELIPELPKDSIALNWGYEINHPFDKEAATFAKLPIPFYVCPGTATWMTLIGRHDTAFENLRLAAKAGRKHGAMGYLNTDWGDGGHPQPLAVSWPLYVAGAALSWCGRSFDEKLLVPVLSRDIYKDPTQRVAKAALTLGVAHRKFDYIESNITPFGTVIAAPPPATRELFCRSGLKYYARIKPRNVRAALAEVERQRAILQNGKPSSKAGAILKLELDLAARMAAQSCKIMLWQQALAAGKSVEARRLAKKGIAELRQLEREFKSYWPLKNKGTTARCSPFLRWRMDDYRRAKLHFPPEVARLAKAKTYAAE